VRDDFLMKIEPIPRASFDAVVALWQAVGLTRPWNDPLADLRRACDGPASAVLVGVSGDRVVATVMVGHDGHRGWVYYLAVAPHARRQVARPCCQPSLSGTWGMTAGPWRQPPAGRGGGRHEPQW
jgi:hypothetical protein